MFLCRPVLVGQRAVFDQLTLVKIRFDNNFDTHLPAEFQFAKLSPSGNYQGCLKLKSEDWVRVVKLAQPRFS